MSELLPPEQHAAIIYAYCVGYLTRNDWQREEAGSGWWWHDAETDLHLLGEAVDIQLHLDGIDVREEP